MWCKNKVAFLPGFCFVLQRKIRALLCRAVPSSHQWGWEEQGCCQRQWFPFSSDIANLQKSNWMKFDNFEKRKGKRKTEGERCPRQPAPNTPPPVAGNK